MNQFAFVANGAEKFLQFDCCFFAVGNGAMNAPQYWQWAMDALQCWQ
jgi:hypothetical protein